MNEGWKVISEFTNYEISDTGRVRRAQPGRGTQCGKILRPFPGGKLGCKYLYVTLRRNNVATKKRVNRLVALAFIGPPRTPDQQVAHFDGDRLNNVLSNLRWATNQENRDEMRRQGSLPSGERHGMARLTWDDVRTIRQAYRRGNGVTLAQRFAVSSATIGRIVRRQAWQENDV